MATATKISEVVRKYRDGIERVAAAERAFEGALAALSDAKSAGRMDELPKRRNACQAAEEALHSTLIEADRLWGAYWSAKLAEEREHLMIALDHLARYNRIARALGDAHPDPAAAVLIEARATGNAARGRLDDGELLPLLRPESEVLLDRSGAWR